MAVRTRWVLLVLTVGGGVLRFYDLGAHSVWLDEYVSIAASRTLSGAVGSFAHPPVPYVALHVWTRVFGTSDVAYRSLAALVGTLCIPIIFATALRAFRSERIALTAALLLAVMPHSIWHARQIRHYTLWPAFVLLAFWSLLAQRDPPVRRGATVAYWVFTSLAAVTHYYSVFYAAAHALAAWFLIGTRPFVKTRAERRRWWRLHLPLVAVAVVLLGYRVASWGQLGIGSAGAWSGNLTRVGWWLGGLVFFRPWAFPDPPSVAVRWGAVVAVGLLAATVLMARDRRADRRTLWALAVVLWLPLLAIELLPILSYVRLLTPTLSVIVLWLAYAVWAPLASRWARVARIAVIAILVVRLGPYLGGVYTLEVEPWRTVCAQIAAEETDRTIVFVNEPYMVPTFRHCYAAAAPILRFPNEKRAVDAESIAAFTAPYDDVWFVYAHAWHTDPRRRGVRALLGTYALVERRSYGPLLESYHLRRDSR